MELSQNWINLFLGRLQNHFGYKKAPGGLKSTHRAYTSNLPLKIWGRLKRLSRLIPSILCSTRRLRTTSVSSSTINMFLSDHFQRFVVEIIFSQQNNRYDFHVGMTSHSSGLNQIKVPIPSELDVVVWNKPSLSTTTRGKHHIERVTRISAEAVLMSGS